MAALEWRIISELLRSRDMTPVHKLGFNAEFLRGEPEAAEIFDYIRQWYHNPDTSREFPTLSSIKRRWPSFKMLKSIETDGGQLSTLLKECKGLVIDSDIRSLVDYFQELVDDDPKTAIQVMQSKLARISYEEQSQQGFTIRDIADDVEAHYRGASLGTIYGIPWPWEVLTADTLGKNPEDFIVLYGRMKSMKTWILLKNAMDDYFIHKKRVLVWSREMNRQKMALRAGSILGKVDYQCLKDGSLPLPLFDNAIASMRMMAAMHDRSQETLRAMKEGSYEGYRDVPDLLFVTGRAAPMTLEELDAVVQAFGPDAVYIDSMYHLSTAEGARAKSVTEQQRALAIGTKSHAIKWGIPVIGTVQGNRDAEKTHGDTLADIGWTDSLAQEADLIIRVLYSEGPEPFEDDYEGYFARLKGEMDAKKKAKEAAHHGRMRLRMSAGAKAKFSRQNKVPQKLQSRFDKLPQKDRTSAELFLMMGGNREGTLKGFSIHCIPGYQWEVTRENVSSNEVKQILDEKAGRETKTSKKVTKRKEVERAVDPAKVGDAFSSLK